MADENEAESGSVTLAAREMASAVNTEQLLKEHAAINGTKIRTRFPPEPNGYLHVGHAKSMNMNFHLAFEKLGVAPENRETIFRFDDTNPEAESNEYIQSLREDVAWLGWQPVKTTHTSDYFPQLHALAVELIRRDKAYVCHQSKADIEASREVAKQKVADPNFSGDPCSPWRNRPIEESLREFENMRRGKYAANEATLRMKMDMLSPNPNMWDQVAYRIKYVAHPHAGDAWCIYPTYDFTHCIIDSLEHVDYSICTLEFETRRESYYWVLQALDLYRPKVYEMSRLNLSYTLLSKRKLLKLVTSGYMRGWDDPRMPTIKGLRRRGYTPDVLNAFCRDVGATRNANVVQYERLAAFARSSLHESAPRLMAVLRPLRVELTGLTDAELCRTLTVPDFPFAPERGSHEVPLTRSLFIDRADFRTEDDPTYFGLAPGKMVGLKYACRIVCEGFDTDPATGEPVLLHCRALSEDERAAERPKTAIQWVAAEAAVPVELRMYNPLFTVEEPTDAGWEAELNPESEVVLSDALCDPSLLLKWRPSPLSSSNLSPAPPPSAPEYFQFERLGFFVLDKDSLRPAEQQSENKSHLFGAARGKGTATGAHGSSRKNLFVFNLTVNLKDSKPKPSGAGSEAAAGGANKSRKEEQARQLAEKMARMSLRPQDMFTGQKGLYSKFDEDGVPTHDVAGEPLSKNNAKKLRKEWEKQKKLFESNNTQPGSG